MPDRQLDQELSTMAIFTHPNHEMATFGTMQRLRPHLLYLTDGGSSTRVKETLKGLESIKWRSEVEMLNMKEESFYQAFLRRDVPFFREVSSTIRHFIQVWGVERIICDAVEFYNPVHDAGLPLVRAALLGLKGLPPREILEAPLVYQKKKDGEVYEFQRARTGRSADAIRVTLTDEEHDAKVGAYQKIYSNLRAMVGALIPDMEHFRTEVLLNAATRLPALGDDCVLRYEWRAGKLKEAGKISDVISYEGHYLPTMTPLFG